MQKKDPPRRKRKGHRLRRHRPLLIQYCWNVLNQTVRKNINMRTDSSITDRTRTDHRMMMTRMDRVRNRRNRQRSPRHRLGRRRSLRLRLLRSNRRLRPSLLKRSLKSRQKNRLKNLTRVWWNPHRSLVSLKSSPVRRNRHQRQNAPRHHLRHQPRRPNLYPHYNLHNSRLSRGRP